MLNSAPENTKGRTCVRPPGDEVYTPSPRRSEGQRGQLGGALFAPHCEQNLYANPKRTAKSFHTHYIRECAGTVRSKDFRPHGKKSATPVRDKRLHQGNLFKQVALAGSGCASRQFNSFKFNNSLKKSLCVAGIEPRGPAVSARTVRATLGAPVPCPHPKPAPKPAAPPRWSHSPT